MNNAIHSFVHSFHTIFASEIHNKSVYYFLTGTRGIGDRFDQQRLTLRIHRGRGSNYLESSLSNGSTHSTSTSIGSSSPERYSKFSTRKHDKIKISVSYPSSEDITSPSVQKTMYAIHYGTQNGKESTSTKISRNNESYLVVKSLPNLEKGMSPRTSKKMGKRNIKAQVKRFRMETKAAKTLAIIVGLFIVCWLPFFTIYLIRAFCDDCIEPLVFSLFFWLGYCNSAINPMIYALFSKDFRFAFKRIICKCFCSGPGFKKIISRRGSDMSQLRTAGRTPSISPSAAANSIDDSDLATEQQCELR